MSNNLDNNTNQNSEEHTSDLTSIQSQTERDSSLIKNYILDLLKRQNIEELRLNYRITPKGLFFSRNVLQAILDDFSQWFANQTSQNKLAEKKAYRKLLQTEHAELLYLLEGPNTLLGFMIPCPIENPQNLRVPYYLGTPSAAKNYLDLNDPLFTSNPAVSSVRERGDLVIKIKFDNKKDQNLELSIAASFLERFRELSKGSIQINKYHPDLEESLSKTAQAMISCLLKSDHVEKFTEPLRPLRYESSQRLHIREHWGFYFLFENKNLVFLYHIYGKNFYDLIYSEVCQNLAKQASGNYQGFKIFKQQPPLLGVFSFAKKNLSLHCHALCSYITAKSEDRIELKSPRTIKSYLADFIISATRAEPIAVNKVLNLLKPNYRKSHNLLVNQRWLYVINHRSTIVECISRYHENKRADHQLILTDLRDRTILDTE